MKKFLTFELKCGTAEGIVTGLASTYGNVDRQGDMVVAGAFAKTLRETGGQVPLLYQHRQDQPIGVATLTDMAAGLAVTGTLVLEVPEARTAWHLMKAGALKSFSIGYDTVKSSRRGAVRVLEELKLWEVSVVTIPANPLAAVSGVKHDEDVNDDLAQFPGALRMLALNVELSVLASKARELTARPKLGHRS